MDLGGLDAAATLDAAAVNLRRRRAADAEMLALAAHWADQHPAVPPGTNGHGVLERPVRLGGEGTPRVMEFAPAELAIALEVHPLSARVLIADVLDLRHRLPRLWHLVTEELAVPAWLARRVAVKTRHLDQQAASAIDERIAGTGHAASLSPGRVLDLVDGLVAAADAAAADADRTHAQARRFVNISDHTADPGTATVFGLVDDEGALQLDATITRLAKALADAGDQDPLDVRRAKALTLLATPALALRHLLGLQPVQAEATDDPELARVLAAIDPAQLAPTAIVYLHLTDTTLFGAHPDAQGVARWEGVGPITRAWLTQLLGHHHVVVKPVHLPAEHRAADSYEYTGTLREAVHLLHPRDIYPYAVGTTRHTDIDHTTNYHDTGPPGQTSIGNAGPMVRHHHRIKTHGPITVQQPRPGCYLWRTRHRQYRLTDHHGTHPLPTQLGDAIFGNDPDTAKLATLLAEHLTGSLARTPATRPWR